MLDSAIQEQLKSVFTKLDKTVVLRVDRSSHANQDELLEMLNDVATCSDKIRVEKTEAISEVPHFALVYDGRLNGISFRGVPGGHEFSSLILAILNSDGKGKWPDEGIIKRVRALKGPVRLRTYISQSCENCPEVVQALNLMAVVHSDFGHEMIDGAVAPDDIERYSIQGVPSVMDGDELIHSGKVSFLDLLDKLENHFGAVSSVQTDENLGSYDVVVIGGGPAGASAAIYSARKGLKVAIVAERFGGQLQDTKGIENMISVPYTEGTKLSAQLSQHVLSYPIRILEHRRVAGVSTGVSKRILLESGEYLDSPIVIVATGAKWRELGIPGEKEHIGQGVAFCAHCDGPFYKGKKVVVVGGGNSGVEAAIDLANIAHEVVLLEYADSLKADTVLVEKLRALSNASVITNARSTAVIGDGRKVIALEYVDRTSNKPVRVETDGVFVQIGLLPNTQFLRETVELTKFGEIVVDAKGRTSVPGIYAAGDVTTTPFKQIVIAMGEGAKVALSAFEDRMRAS